MRSIIACLAAFLAAAPALAQSHSESIDGGSFVVYLKDRAIGAERFEVSARADSINAGARSYLKIRGKDGEEVIEKGMILTATRADFALRYYQSDETRQGQTLVIGVVASEDDTAITIFREQRGGAGAADRLVAPPGRMFVLDAGIYSLFNLLCLNLHGKTFVSRPLTLLTLGAARDTILEAEVTDLGTETIRWGARPVQARKLQFRDRETVFLAWANPAGRMLRLTHEVSGLRVERDPPPVKKPATTPKPGG